MALMCCPECQGKVSDRAASCPHCGFPIAPPPRAKVGRPKKKPSRSQRLRLPNGFGSIAKLSGGRNKPYWARIITDKDLRGYPIYLTIGYFATWDEAYTALDEYHKKPYDPAFRNMTFAQVYDLLLKEKEQSPKGLSKSLKYCFQASYKKMNVLHSTTFRDISALALQPYLNDTNRSHAALEHDKNLLLQMYKVAIKYNICQQNLATLLTIGKADDDEPGIPFTEAEVKQFWLHQEIPGMDTILILCYSGWRVGEFLKMQTADVDLDHMVFISGSKTDAGKNRPVPIHSSIQPLVRNLYHSENKMLYPGASGKMMSYKDYSTIFSSALSSLGITSHTPHDCRHTFASMLDRYEANEISSRKLLGHAQKDVHEKYIHKTIDDLREAIELIPGFQPVNADAEKHLH